MRFYTYPCTFGHFCLVTEEDFVCGIELAETPEEAAFLAGQRFAKIDEPKIFEEQTVYLVDAIKDCINNGTSPNVKFRFKFGTWFQIHVWFALSRIKLGQTISYKALAEEAGHPYAIRATANAVAANPVAIVIPCHRVILADGSVGKYRWGAKIKEKLLDRETLGANSI